MAGSSDITPLPESLRAAAAAGRVASVILFGGSFDPVQRAHVELAARARDAVEKQSRGEVWLLYVPAARSPFKPDPPIATDPDRVEMLRLATAGMDHAAVWTDEIDRAATQQIASFTIDTLRRARAELDSLGDSGAAVALRLLMGSDQAAQFHRWREPAAIMSLAEPLVMLRADGGESLRRAPPAAADFEQAMRASGAWSEPEISDWNRRAIPVGAMEISSTQVRAQLARPPHDKSRLLALLHPAVLDYIERHRLYA